MSFGFGVGDFLAVLDLAKKLKKQFSDAPQEFQDLSRNVRSLAQVLDEVHDYTEIADLTEAQGERLDFIVGQCRATLGDVDKVLCKHLELDEKQQSGHRARRIWKRLKWDGEEAQKLRLRLSENIASLTAFLTFHDAAVTQITSKRVVQVVSYQEHEQRQKLLQEISAIDHHATHNEIFEKRQPGTGLWFLQTDNFITWKRETASTLFCTGIPGAGKSVMTATVINDVRTTTKTDIGVAWYYFKATRRDLQKPSLVLRSILRQLLENLSDWSSVGIEAGDATKILPRIRDISIEQLKEYIVEASGSYQACYIILDALDECTDEGEERSTIVEHILEMQKLTRCHLFLTSRHVPQVLELFTDYLSEEIIAQAEDVKTFLNGRVAKFPLVAKDTEYIERIVHTIVYASDGVFLLANLHVNTLRHKRTLEALDSALETLPSGSAAYDETYEQIMLRIEDQPVDDRNLAKRVLAWIVFSGEELEHSQLLRAVAIRIGSASMSERSVPDLNTVMSLCAGLIKLETQNLRLCHYTAYEYLERSQKRWFGNVNLYLARSCITYLCIAREPWSSLIQLYERRKKSDWALYLYAARHWGHHAREAGLHIDELLDFLEEYQSFQTAAIFLILDMRTYYVNIRGRLLLENLGDYPDLLRVPPLIISAYFSLAPLTVQLLHNGENPNERVFADRTALIIAAEYANLEVFRRLLGHKDSNPSLRETITDRDALSFAAELGREDQVRLLLATGQVDIIAGDLNSATSLFHATANGYFKIVELFLAFLSSSQNDDDVVKSAAIQNALGVSLETAIVLGYIDVIEVMLNSKLAASITNLAQRLAQHLLWTSDEEILDLCLSYQKITIEQQDQFGATLLIQATKRKKINIVEQLVELGADVHAKDNEGETWLHWLVFSNLDHLLENHLHDLQADLNAQNRLGLTPLHLACQGGSRNVRTRKLLLEAGVDVSIRENEGLTALHYAAMSNDPEGLIDLLDSGANPNLADNAGMTPLMLMFRQTTPPLRTMVEILLHGHADANSHDTAGNNVLIHALAAPKYVMEELEYRQSLEALITAGADVNAIGALGMPVLLHAIVTIREARKNATLQTLLDRGADPNVRDSEGVPMLCRAAELGRSKAVEVLLDAGAMIEARDRKGRTAVMYAAARGRFSVVKTLLEYGGADSRARTLNGQLALDIASRAKQRRTANILNERMKTQPLRQGTPVILSRRGSCPAFSNLSNPLYSVRPCFECLERPQRVNSATYQSIEYITELEAWQVVRDLEEFLPWYDKDVHFKYKKNKRRAF